MPKNTRPAGRGLPEYVLNSMGVWVRSKFAGARLNKNSRISDHQWLQEGEKHKRKTHTSPIVRTKQNDGHDNPARMRHERTKRVHAAKRNGVPSQGSIPCPS